jgi:parallel beta-helix repeat protein
MYFLAVCGTALSAILEVPSDYPDIQTAIDDANDGDTVLVAPGTYTGDGNRDIDFNGKAITVRSENGPQTCIIECEASRDDCHRGFYFHNSEDANSVVEGFTITGGYISGSYARGGGIYCRNASPCIVECILTNNVALWNGGGVYCENASPRIADCIVTGNVALRDGGGIVMVNSNSVITGCVVSHNTANSPGTDWGYGGGVILTSCDDLMLVNCLVTGNFASRGGGAMQCDSSNVVLTNCTICDNRAEDRAGGIYCGAAYSNWVILNNCIVGGNNSNDDAGNQIRSSGAATILGAARLELNHCVIQGGDSSIMANRVSGSWTDADPLFAEPGYWDPNETSDELSDDFWVDGDYHLKSQAGRWDPNSQSWVQDDVTSPCIDAGDPNDPIGDEPFPNGGRINIGAYGGTAEASKSYFGEPTSDTIIAGDINGDGKVDWKDFEILARNWLRSADGD